MSKFSIKNKLIEKQLKQLNKKEEKLILEKEPGIIKNKLDQKGHQFISSFLNKITAPKDIRMTVDVDPLDIL